MLQALQELRKISPSSLAMSRFWRHGDAHRLFVHPFGMVSSIRTSGACEPQSISSSASQSQPSAQERPLTSSRRLRTTCRCARARDPESVSLASRLRRKASAAPAPAGDKRRPWPHLHQRACSRGACSGYELCRRHGAQDMCCPSETSHGASTAHMVSLPSRAVLGVPLARFQEMST